MHTDSPTDPTSHRTPEAMMSAVALRDALRAGELSATEAAEHYLARIAAREDLGAFVSVTAESALREAGHIDRVLVAHRADRESADAPLPPLLGVPIAHKDLVDVAGATTTNGSAAWAPRIAGSDHPGVAVLRAAGTVSLGKTQVPELGLTGYSENLIAPPARNPFDVTRTPGGSSGGSAAAVAAGLLPVAPGSDGGGSIRIPALACGLIGLKPGLGTVPTDVLQGREDDFGGPRLTVTGPLARSAADAALLMDALAQPGARGSHADAVLRADDLSGVTVAASTASPFDSAFEIALSPAARDAFEGAAEELSVLGHHVGHADVLYDPEYADFFTEGWISGLSQLGLSAEKLHRLTPLTRSFVRRASARSATQHQDSARRLRGFARSVREQWGRTDVVLTPGLARPAPHIGEFMALSPEADYELQCQWAPYTSMVNVAGLPAIAVPRGLDEAGLPVGVQLIGRRGSEPLLLALAAQLTRTA